VSAFPFLVGSFVPAGIAHFMESVVFLFFASLVTLVVWSRRVAFTTSIFALGCHEERIAALGLMLACVSLHTPAHGGLLQV
jgi:hypothetical protein